VDVRAYRGLASLATPLAGIVLARRLRRGKENPARLAERRGEAKIMRPPGPLIWAHGASVGECSPSFRWSRLCAGAISMCW